MPKRAVFQRSRRELSLDVSVGVHILLVVGQSSLGSQSRGCAKTPILTLCMYVELLVYKDMYQYISLLVIKSPMHKPHTPSDTRSRTVTVQYMLTIDSCVLVYLCTINSNQVYPLCSSWCLSRACRE